MVRCLFWALLGAPGARAAGDAADAVPGAYIVEFSGDGDAYALYQSLLDEGSIEVEHRRSFDSDLFMGAPFQLVNPTRNGLVETFPYVGHHRGPAAGHIHDGDPNRLLHGGLRERHRYHLVLSRQVCITRTNTWGAPADLAPGFSGLADDPRGSVASRIAGQGIIVVISAGNDGDEGLVSDSSPATGRGVIVRGAPESTVLPIILSGGSYVDEGAGSTRKSFGSLQGTPAASQTYIGHLPALDQSSVRE
ncbi:Uu.00g083930.m01.CDS01 [Anthostomella pinea]|uniref:Uu.00g083930.m01.CDS01 n=1 Tax=Anthostomella pinea TaxID=933095 RepID=A0AAI8VMA2_9PEZI|nr:Uu.00g083930.m01.CDS01 [Anthostomella pinea]